MTGNTLFAAAAVPRPVQAASSPRPDEAEKFHNRGNTLQMQGDLDAAIESYRKALALKPDHAQVHNNLGIALEAQGRHDEAVGHYRKALTLKPDYAKAHNNLANVLLAQGSLEEAVEHYRKALALEPGYAEAHNNLGGALMAQNELAAANESFRKALALKPDYAEAHYNLGNALQIQEQPDAAAESYRKALALQPYHVGAYNNLGTVLLTQGKLDEALNCYRNVLMMQPDLAGAHSNLGNALRDQGKLDQAVASYRKALALQPDYAEAYDNLLLTLSYQCLPEPYLAEARSYGSKVMDQARPYTRWLNEATDGQRLRVGLVSGDLRNHPVGFFLESILAHLDPGRIELVAYSTVPQEDALSARIKPRFAAWNTIADLNDQAAASKIHQDGVQILIDLAGHTAHNRLPAFAWKPAPVQLSWLGYWASTGIPGMDYLLADPVSVPESHRAHFTETVWYLPDTRLCFTPPAASPALTVKPLPAVDNGYITFGSFQGLTKINDDVLAAWGRIFQALPGARLRLQNKQINCPATTERLRQRLAGVGITPERVTMASNVAREEYLAAHAEVDIILDTFPYAGGTTTCEAMWMGVPTLTLAGGTLLARQGASLLACAGLADWIAENADDYVDLAISHATDMDRLAGLRSRLREQVLASPLFDGPRFARQLEDALHGIWQAKTVPA